MVACDRVGDSGGWIASNSGDIPPPGSVLDIVMRDQRSVLMTLVVSNRAQGVWFPYADSIRDDSIHELVEALIRLDCSVTIAPDAASKSAIHALRESIGDSLTVVQAVR